MNYDDWKLATPTETSNSLALEIDRAELVKKQNAIGLKQCGLDCIIGKAMQKIEKIKTSQCIEYNLSGGYFARQRDLLNAEKVLNRLESYYKKLDQQWDELESQIDEINAQLK